MTSAPTQPKAKTPRSLTRTPKRGAVTAERKAARSRLVAREPRQVGDFAMVAPHRAIRAQAQTAARLHDGKVEGHTPGPASSHDRLWQTQVYNFVDVVGELGYVINLTANAVAACDVRVMEINADGDEVESDDPRAQRVLQAFTGLRGGPAKLRRDFAWHMLLAGESYLVGTPAEDHGVELGITWEFLSTEELRIDAAGHATRVSDGSLPKQLPADAYVARAWQSDPRWSGRATSAVRRVLPILSELVQLTQMIDGVIASRLPAAMLYLPTEVSFAAEDDESGEEAYGEDAIDPLTRILMEHMSAAKEDQTNPASWVPLVMRGPGDSKKNVGLIELAKDMTTWAMELRNEALQRLGGGLDVPPEIMHGKGGLSHWAAAGVDIEYVVKHVAPVGDLFVDFSTHAYYRPMLEEFEGMSPDDAGRFRLIFDPNAIMSRADESTTARALWDRRAIATAAMVRRSGLDESDMPDPEEAKARIALDLITKNAYMAPFLLRFVPGFEDVEIDVGLGYHTANNEIELPGQNVDDPTVKVSETEAAPADAPDTGPSAVGSPTADTAPGPAQTDTAPGMALLEVQVATAAHAALERAVERAATRLCTARPSDAVLRSMLAKTNKTKVFQTVSANDLRRAGITDLFAGCWDNLAGQVQNWVRDHLVLDGANPLAADEAAVAVAQALTAGLDAHLAEHLHDPGGLPFYANGLRVPVDLATAALDATRTGALA